MKRNSLSPLLRNTVSALVGSLSSTVFSFKGFECNMKYNDLTEEEKRLHKIEARREYRAKNKQKIKESAKIYYIKNREYVREYYRINCNKEKKSLYMKNRYIKNKEVIKAKVRKYKNERIKNDPIFKFYCLISSKIRKAFNSNGYNKKSKTENIVGCTFEYFKTYIENKFEPWMSWEKHGKYNGCPNYGFDLDHIVPISTAKSIDDVIRLNHYTNFQPLCSYINRDVKKDKLND